MRRQAKLATDGMRELDRCGDTTDNIRKIIALCDDYAPMPDA